MGKFTGEIILNTIDRAVNLFRQHCCHLMIFFFLGLIAGVLYFSQVTRLSLSLDGFLAAYLIKIGDYRDPSRPFLELGWQLATMLTGGSVSGYNGFMFSCLFFSALLVYALVWTLLPRQPVWALLASTLKLVWSANFEVFDNSGLAIYFSESLFWLACWLYTCLTLERIQLSQFKVFFTSLVMTVSLFIVVGTYQTSWPVVILVPLALLGFKVMRWRKSRAYLLFLWYLTALPMMFWSFLQLGQSDSANKAFQEIPHLPEILNRLLAGLWAATGQSLAAPFAPTLTYTTFGLSAFVVLIILVFTVLLAWTGLQSWPELQKQPAKQISYVILLLVLLSLAVVTATLLPPLVIHLPSYGTRVMHWPAIGTILGVVAILAGLYRMHRWVGGTLSAVLALFLVAGMAQQTYNIGNHYASNSFLNRRFWEDLSIEAPKIDEGTVVLMDGPPLGIATDDRFSTWVLRALTAETHMTFFITDSKPQFDPQSLTYTITSVVDLENKQPLISPRRYLRDPVFPIKLAKPQTFQVPAHLVVWVRWDWVSRRLQVVPKQSAMERLHHNILSVWGEILFPRPTIEYNRARDNNPPL